mmetsp:Transcript_30059/g.71428  ORF Transcript_30059/g.71428 Transcript_30059/m.71428 type:complete len:256 (-) Transcript_30059:281-1048(-)
MALEQQHLGAAALAAGQPHAAALPLVRKQLGHLAAARAGGAGKPSLPRRIEQLDHRPAALRLRQATEPTQAAAAPQRHPRHRARCPGAVHLARRARAATQPAGRPHPRVLRWAAGADAARPVPQPARAAHTRVGRGDACAAGAHAQRQLPRRRPACGGGPAAQALLDQRRQQLAVRPAARGARQLRHARDAQPRGQLHRRRAASGHLATAAPRVPRPQRQPADGPAARGHWLPIGDPRAQAAQQPHRRHAARHHR